MLHLTAPNPSLFPIFSFSYDTYTRDPQHTRHFSFSNPCFLTLTLILSPYADLAPATALLLPQASILTNHHSLDFSPSLVLASALSLSSVTLIHPSPVSCAHCYHPHQIVQHPRPLFIQGLQCLNKAANPSITTPQPLMHTVFLAILLAISPSCILLCNCQCNLLLSLQLPALQTECMPQTT